MWSHTKKPSQPRSSARAASRATARGSASWLNGPTSIACFMTAILGRAVRQAERGEHRWLLEGGNLGQPAVLVPQYDEHERGECGLAGAAEVPGRARLPVGPDRQHPPLAKGSHAIAKRVAHLPPAVPLPDLGGDGQPDVVAQHRDQRLRVGLLMRVDEALQQQTLPWVGFGGGRPVQPPVGPLLAQRRAGTLERAGDRGDARTEYPGDLGGGQTDHVAEDQHGPLARRQELNSRQEGQRDRFPAYRHRLRAWLVGGYLVQQRVRVGLDPWHRDDRRSQAPRR